MSKIDNLTFYELNLLLGSDTLTQAQRKAVETRKQELAEMYGVDDVVYASTHSNTPPTAETVKYAPMPSESQPFKVDMYQE